MSTSKIILNSSSEEGEIHDDNDDMGIIEPPSVQLKNENEYFNNTIDDVLKLKTVKKKEKKKLKKHKSEKKVKKVKEIKDKDKSIDNKKEDFKEPEKILDFNPSWKESDVIANQLGIYNVTVENTINLFKKGYTVPFIARYRKHITNLEPDNLRKVESLLDDLKDVRKRMSYVSSTIEKFGCLDNKIKSRLSECITIDELDYLFAPYKPGSKRSKAQKARELGLENCAKDLLNNSSTALIDMTKMINTEKDGLRNIKEIRKGVQYILSDIISKDKECLDIARDICLNRRDAIRITCSKAPLKPDLDDGQSIHSYLPNPDKNIFQNYYNFNISALSIKPHQILAINRGENQKELTVKLIVGEYLTEKWRNFCKRKYVPISSSLEVSALIVASIDDAFSRLVSPVLIRECRSKLTKHAEKASLEVFSSNLRKMLMTPPINNKIIMGVDPGYSHGCKWAIISEQSVVLDSGISYLHERDFDEEGTVIRTKKKGLKYEGEDFAVIKGSLFRFNCELVAIGNGKASFETQEFFAKHIQSGSFKPLNVQFTVVDESGASVYSVSDLAKRELRNLEINLRGAVSIARRLQNPLSELVKIDAKNLGVGQYQHDLRESSLKKALDKVVEECVSFVGVNLNTCSCELLSYVAGLGPTLARRIIELREIDGNFVSRQQLLMIKGIGPRTFKQISGFLRIYADTSKEIIPPNNVKDAGDKLVINEKPKLLNEKLNEVYGLHSIFYPDTIQYKLAKEIIKDCGAKECEIGNDKFISTIKSYFSMASVSNLAKVYNVSTVTLTEIYDKLCSKIDINNIIKREPIENISIAAMKRKIVETTIESKMKKKKIEIHPDFLDRTSVHPENYDLAKEIIKDAKLDICNIGSEEFVNAINTFRTYTTIENLSSLYKTEKEVLLQIFDSLSEKANSDIRDFHEKPVFRNSLKKISDLREGDELNGVVNNVTHFGAFVDVGIGTNGLLHVSKLPEDISKSNVIQRGSRVKVKVIYLDIDRNKLSLDFVAFNW